MILVVSMPDVSGLTFANVLRNPNPSTRILMKSGLGKEDGQQTKAPFIAKPFSKDSLLLSLHELLVPDRPNAAHLGATI